MSNRGYKAEIKEVVGITLTAKEKIALTVSDSSIALDAYLEENGEFDINNIKGMVTISVHNEKAKGDKDYDKYIIVAEDGTMYSTGSASFVDTFLEIFDTMMEAKANGEVDTWGVHVFRRPSKNYTGKYFLTCSVI